ncbi:histidine phosphatase family protein [Actinomadura sp. NBRC 104425]|uniref:SixA phosphatase family protein n=1 Tax=Actinomadura sp. NBRC 104425 TaxID=3032204 RepID=UPI0025549751|nr:histidine phosphatase family protein [Actinomadura sp. NBRC 104425]
MPTLLVLRHAKAVPGGATPDIERSLTGRGRRDAEAAGEWLRDRGLAPDLVLCSTAVRTRETLERLAVPAPVRYESQIYANDADGLLTLVRETGDDARTLLLVGHNPSVHQLVHDLTGAAPNAFPTCALAVIEWEGGWMDAWPGAGTLVTLHTPQQP